MSSYRDNIHVFEDTFSMARGPALREQTDRMVLGTRVYQEGFRAPSRPLRSERAVGAGDHRRDQGSVFGQRARTSFLSSRRSMKASGRLPGSRSSAEG